MEPEQPRIIIDGALRTRARTGEDRGNTKRRGYMIIVCERCQTLYSRSGRWLVAHRGGHVCERAGAAHRVNDLHARAHAMNDADGTVWHKTIDADAHIHHANRVHGECAHSTVHGAALPLQRRSRTRHGHSGALRGAVTSIVPPEPQAPWQAEPPSTASRTTLRSSRRAPPQPHPACRRAQC